MRGQYLRVNLTLGSEFRGYLWSPIRVFHLPPTDVRQPLSTSLGEVGGWAASRSSLLELSPMHFHVQGILGDPVHFVGLPCDRPYCVLASEGLQLSLWFSPAEMPLGPHYV